MLLFNILYSVRNTKEQICFSRLLFKIDFAFNLRKYNLQKESIIQLAPSVRWRSYKRHNYNIDESFMIFCHSFIFFFFFFMYILPLHAISLEFYMLTRILGSFSNYFYHDCKINTKLS